VLRKLRNFSFLLLVATAIYAKGQVARADEWPCSYVEWGNSDACETSRYTVCAPSPDPSAYACELDFEDTCEAYCGEDNVADGGCYVEGLGYPAGDPGWNCVNGWFIRCICEN
jgi:hypothetical protein